MKTLKFALVAALIACTMVSLASVDNRAKEPTIKIVNVTFAKAMTVPGLVTAMYQQLNSDFLNPFIHYFTREVGYNRVLYVITGDYDQWHSFFYGSIKLRQSKKTTIKIDD